MMRSRRNKQSGFMSIDALGWTIFAVIVLGFVAAAVWKVLTGTDSTIELSNVTALMSNTKQLKTRTGYGPSGTDLMPSLIAIDGTGGMSVSGATVTNQYNGAVTLVSNGMTYTLTSTNYPKSACIALSTKAAKDTLTTTKINGGSAISGEVQTAAATTACSGDTNTLSWTSY